MNNEEDFYTAGQAMEKLGFTKPTFFRKVKEGQIPKVVPPGKRQGVYPKDVIDAMSSAMEMVYKRPPELPAMVFSKSSPAEQREEMQIGIEVFGSEFITPLNLRMAFQFKSEFTFYSLKVLDQATSRYHVVGYISMFRFTGEFLESLLEGTRIERDITLDDVLKFEKDTPFDIYIDVLAVDPAISLSHRHRYTGEIIAGFADVILNLLANRYQIRTLYTVTSTKDGDNLVNRRGFARMEGKSKVPGRVAYKLELDDVGVQRLQELSRRG